MVDRAKLQEELSKRPGMELVDLDVLIEDAIQDFCDFTHLSEEEISSAAESCLKDLAAFRFNTLGVEGLQSEGQSGVSTSYSADFPARIKAKMRRFRRLNYVRK